MLSIFWKDIQKKTQNKTENKKVGISKQFVCIWQNIIETIIIM